MVRVRNSVARRKRRKRVLKDAKGQFGHKNSRFVQAKRSVIKGLTYSYRDRKVKKREFKRLWIIRINAACQEFGIGYSRFIKGLTDSGVAINRKILADLAVSAPATFKKLVEMVHGSSVKASTAKKKATTAKQPTEKTSKAEKNAKTKSTKSSSAKALTKSA